MYAHPYTRIMLFLYSYIYIYTCKRTLQCGTSTMWAPIHIRAHMCVYTHTLQCDTSTMWVHIHTYVCIHTHIPRLHVQAGGSCALQAPPHQTRVATARHQSVSNMFIVHICMYTRVCMHTSMASHTCGNCSSSVSK